MLVNNYRYPGLDYTKLKRGSLVLIKDRVKSSGRLDFGVITQRLKPHQGDHHRRYKILISHGKRNTAHPVPLSSPATITKNHLVRTGENLIYIGRPKSDNLNFPLFFDDSFTQGKEFFNADFLKREGLFTKSHIPDLIVSSLEGADALSSDSEPENMAGVPSSQPWLFGREATDPLATTIVEPLDEDHGVMVEDVPDDLPLQQVTPEATAIETPCPGNLSDIYSILAIDKLAPNLFLAVAGSIMFDQTSVIKKGKRKDHARDLRNQTFSHMIYLTHDENANSIFNLQDVPKDDVFNYLNVIRELASSFLARSNQWTCPASILDQITDPSMSLVIAAFFEDQLVNFIAQLLQRPVYLHLSETKRTYLFQGFSILNTEMENRPILLDLRVNTYSGVSFDNGYQDIMETLYRVSGTHEALVSPSDIKTALELTFRKNHPNSLNLNI